MLTTGALAPTNNSSQSNLINNTDEETTIRMCNRLANFILENHLNEYNNDSV